MKKPNEKVFDIISKLAGLCRTGDYGNASSLLNQLVLEMSAYLKSAALSPDRVKKLQFSLETLYLMQKSKDWVGLADVLEYELKELMTNDE